ncbi:MAG: heparinase II/III-family protein [Clostridiales bacterium]|nr:heparinase II/III-family protein [Clostridiales bacterium]
MNLHEIVEALEAGSADSMLPEAKDLKRMKTVSTHPFYRSIRAPIEKAADELSGSPIASLPFSLLKKFDDPQGGSRREYEDVYFSRRKRLTAFAASHLISPSSERLSDLEDAIWAICDEYSWCLPAHMGFSEAQYASGAPFIDDSGLFFGKMSRKEQLIDLFAAETAFSLSEITSIISGINPMVVRRAREEVFKRALIPYMSFDSDARSWECGSSNWAAVCAGGLGASAMYLIREPLALGRYIHRVLSSMETFLSGFSDDGACLEGLSYWSYGFGFFIYFADLLKARTNGIIDLTQGAKVKKIMLFQQKCFLGLNKTISFSDAPRECGFVPGLTYYLKKSNPEVEIPDKSLMLTFGDDHCFRWPVELRSLLWPSPDVDGGAALKDGFFAFSDAQWCSARFKGFSFACKGGVNAEPHNHNDVGSFLAAGMGEWLIVDPGAGSYTKKYFGSERYELFTPSSRGHSVPIINGRHQMPGTEFRACAFEAREGAKEIRIGMNLAGAYGIGDMIALNRSFRVFKDGSGMEMTDSFEFLNPPESVVERFITLREPELSEAGALIKTCGSQAILEWNQDEAEASLFEERRMAHHEIEETLYCLDLRLKSQRSCFSFRIKIKVEAQ